MNNFYQLTMASFDIVETREVAGVHPCLEGSHSYFIVNCNTMSLT